MDNNKLLIFDIDGTLTDSGGLTRIALEQAAFDIYGVEHATQGIVAHGQTDRTIFEEILSNNGLSVDDYEEHFANFSRRYIECLDSIIYDSPRPRLHNGVTQLLERLTVEPDIRLALGTGNIEPGARMKLNRHQVDTFFPVGGFGSDSSDRREVIRKAYERSCEFYNINFPLMSVWIIGDTPNDIDAARALGARNIIVTTGIFSSEQLVVHKPDYILSDLSAQSCFCELSVTANHR